VPADQSTSPGVPSASGMSGDRRSQRLQDHASAQAEALQVARAEEARACASTSRPRKRKREASPQPAPQEEELSGVELLLRAADELEAREAKRARGARSEGATVGGG
jgi:hypothetical protein